MRRPPRRVASPVDALPRRDGAWAASYRLGAQREFPSGRVPARDPRGCVAGAAGWRRCPLLVVGGAGVMPSPPWPGDEPCGAIAAPSRPKRRGLDLIAVIGAATGILYAYACSVTDGTSDALRAPQSVTGVAPDGGPVGRTHGAPNPVPRRVRSSPDLEREMRGGEPIGPGRRNTTARILRITGRGATIAPVTPVDANHDRRAVSAVEPCHQACADTARRVRTTSC